MKIEIKKLELIVSGGVKGKGGGELKFVVEDYSQEMTPDELKEYLELIKELFKSLNK